MHFSVNKEHRDFFRNNSWIECDDIITSKEQNFLSQGINNALSIRLKMKPSTISQLSPGQIFSVGRDLWREDPLLKKILLRRNLAEIASELTEQKPLRMGYTTLFHSNYFAEKESLDPLYTPFINSNPTLSEISNIQGVVCGALLCVSLAKEESLLNSETEILNDPSTLFTKKAGNGIFFSPEWPLPLHELKQRAGYTYLLIVYTQARAVFIKQELDPHLNFFKLSGHQFGDRLNDLQNPIVYS